MTPGGNPVINEWLADYAAGTANAPLKDTDPTVDRLAVRTTTTGTSATHRTPARTPDPPISARCTRNGRHSGRRLDSTPVTTPARLCRRVGHAGKRFQSRAADRRPRGARQHVRSHANRGGLVDAADLVRAVTTIRIDSRGNPEPRLGVRTAFTRDTPWLAGLVLQTRAHDAVPHPVG